MKFPNQNCTSFVNGMCTHQAAPRRWFGPAICILNWPPDDARVMPGCALQTPYLKPNPPPKAP